MYNAGSDLQQCLAALAESQYNDFGVLVVDDGSTEPVKPLVSAYGFRYLRIDGPGGPARARNYGVMCTSSPYVVFIDADVCVHPHTLAQFAAAFAAEPKVVPVWPGAAPGSESWKYEEKEVPGQDGAARISNVTRPTLTVFLPEASKATGTAVIICPGGGFRFLSFTHEGTELARWLNSIGVAAFVLKYRLMRTGGRSAAQ